MQSIIKIRIKRKLTLTQEMELREELEGYAQEFMEQEWDEKKSEK